MKEFCIPKTLADNLKEAARSGAIDIKQLYTMDSEARRAVFEKYTDRQTAVNINTGFEEAIVSAQKDSLKNWAQSTFTEKQKKTKSYQDVLTKIDQLDDIGALDVESADIFLHDLVASRLGVAVSSDEIASLASLSADLEEIASRNPVNEFGQPSREYLKKRKEVNDYIESITPSSDVSLFTGIISKGNLLFKPSSIFLNIQSNAFLGALEATVKRISTGVKSGLNNDLARRYIREQVLIYKESGFDLSRMISGAFTPTLLGEKQLSSQGKGTVKRIARFYEDTIFKYGLGLPDVFSASMAFADSLNIYTTKQAYREGLAGDAAKARAKELFLEATRLDSTNEIANEIRARGIADAQKATFTDESNFAKVATSIRSTMNQATGRLRLGDLLIPFVKTPANVIARGYEYTGGGFVTAALNLRPALQAAAKGDNAKLDMVIQNAVKSGLGLTLAVIIVAALDPDDYQGQYPSGLFQTKEREMMKLENAPANSLRIGETWISLDYFGVLSPFIKGMASARFESNADDSTIARAFRVASSYGSDIGKLPGIKEASDMLGFISNTQNIAKEDLEGAFEDVARDSVDFISSRTIPSVLGDLAKIFDGTERQTDYKQPLEGLQAKIPGLRQLLPAKVNTFGEEIKAENPLTIALFGGRVKTKQQEQILDELNTLQRSDNLPTITPPEKTSTRVKALETQLTKEKYDQFLKEFKTELKTEWYKAISSKDYTGALTDGDKKTILNDVRTDLLETKLNKFGYKTPKK